MSEVKGEVEGTGQQEEEVVDLFAKGFDDTSLTESETSEDKEGEGEGAGSTENADDLPEKYRGKSIKDIVEMHQNLERAYGRHNNELGELRHSKQRSGSIRNQTILSSVFPSFRPSRKVWMKFMHARTGWPVN